MMARKRVQNFFKGAAMALPIAVGYTAIGIPFGILAAKVGLPVWGVAAMSFFVFAGSSQFVAIQLLGAGSGILPIITATLILNSRHLLMGMSLGGASSRIDPPLMAYITHSMTDESYGVNIIKASSGEKIGPIDMLGTNIVAHLSWVAATVVGAWAGNIIPIDTKCAEGALPIMFAVLLGLQFVKARFILWAAVAAIVTILLMQLLPDNWPFLVAALVVPTFATIYEVMKNDR